MRGPWHELDEAEIRKHAACRSCLARAHRAPGLAIQWDRWNDPPAPLLDRMEPTEVDPFENEEEDQDAVREALCHLARVAREESARLAEIAPLTSAAFAEAADVLLFGPPLGPADDTKICDDDHD